MKLKKALQKLSYYLDAERREQLAEYDSIKKVLRKLRSKRNQITEKLQTVEDEVERKELQSKLDIVNAQRKKGVKLLLELRSYRKKNKSNAWL